MHFHRFCSNEDERRKWQNPEVILQAARLKLGSTFIDIGAGGGFFAIPAAKIVGRKGKVYASDIDKEAIVTLKNHAERAGLKNMVLKVERAEESILCESCADMVFFGIVLHDFDDVSKVLSNAKRMLKPTGRLVDLGWKKKPTPYGPPLQIRFSQKTAALVIEKAGFKVESIKPEGPYHYLIIARP